MASAADDDAWARAQAAVANVLKEQAQTGAKPGGVKPAASSSKPPLAKWAPSSAPRAPVDMKKINEDAWEAAQRAVANVLKEQGAKATSRPAPAARAPVDMKKVQEDAWEQAQRAVANVLKEQAEAAAKKAASAPASAPAYAPSATSAPKTSSAPKAASSMLPKWAPNSKPAPAPAARNDDDSWARAQAAVANVLAEQKKKATTTVSRPAGSSKAPQSAADWDRLQKDAWEEAQAAVARVLASQGRK